MTRDEAMTMLRTSHSSSEWYRNRAEIHKCCGYPEWWFEDVIASGEAGRILSSFGSAPEIRLRGGYVSPKE